MIIARLMQVGMGESGAAAEGPATEGEGTTTEGEGATTEGEEASAESESTTRDAEVTSDTASSAEIFTGALLATLAMLM